MYVSAFEGGKGSASLSWALRSGLLKTPTSHLGQSEILSDTMVTLAILGKVEIAKMPDNTGAPDTIRTCDLCLRRATLYPAELRVRYRLI
jgi:hypothetical protein